jgi:hypothetical protein
LDAGKNELVDLGRCKSYFLVGHPLNFTRTHELVCSSCELSNCLPKRPLFPNVCLWLPDRAVDSFSSSPPFNTPFRRRLDIGTRCPHSRVLIYVVRRSDSIPIISWCLCACAKTNLVTDIPLKDPHCFPTPEEVTDPLLSKSLLSNILQSTEKDGNQKGLTSNLDPTFGRHLLGTSGLGKR